jgi:hypothetical protein
MLSVFALNNLFLIVSFSEKNQIMIIIVMMIIAVILNMNIWDVVLSAVYAYFINILNDEGTYVKLHFTYKETEI